MLLMCWCSAQLMRAHDEHMSVAPNRKPTAVRDCMPVWPFASIASLFSWTGTEYILIVHNMFPSTMTKLAPELCKTMGVTNQEQCV